jgi:hypothetical protein
MASPGMLKSLDFGPVGDRLLVKGSLAEKDR